MATWIFRNGWIRCETFCFNVTRERCMLLLAHSFLFCSCVCFCHYGPFNCISFHNFSRQLSVFSLCSSGFISALLVLSTTYLSFMKVSLGPDIILCGRLGLKHQVTGSLLKNMSTPSPSPPHPFTPRPHSTLEWQVPTSHFCVLREWHILMSLENDVHPVLLAQQTCPPSSPHPPCH